MSEMLIADGHMEIFSFLIWINIQAASPASASRLLYLAQMLPISFIFTILSSFPPSPLFTPLLEALGPRSRLIHGTQTLPWLDKKSHWSCRNPGMSCISTVKQIGLGREKLSFGGLAAEPFLHLPIPHRGWGPAGKGNWMGGARPYLDAFWLPKYCLRGHLSPLNFLNFFRWRIYPHLTPVALKNSVAEEECEKIKTMKNQHIRLASCDPSRGMQSKKPGDRTPRQSQEWDRKKSSNTATSNSKKLQATSKNLQSDLSLKGRESYEPAAKSIYLQKVVWEKFSGKISE